MFKTFSQFFACFSLHKAKCTVSSIHGGISVGNFLRILVDFSELRNVELGRNDSLDVTETAAGINGLNRSSCTSCQYLPSSFTSHYSKTEPPGIRLSHSFTSYFTPFSSRLPSLQRQAIRIELKQFTDSRSKNLFQSGGQKCVDRSYSVLYNFRSHLIELFHLVNSPLSALNAPSIGKHS